MIIIPAVSETAQVVVATCAVIAFVAWAVNVTTKRDEERRQKAFWLAHMDEAAREEVRAYQVELEARNKLIEALQAQLADANGRIVAAKLALERVREVNLRVLRRKAE